MLQAIFSQILLRFWNYSLNKFKKNNNKKDKTILRCSRLQAIFSKILLRFWNYSLLKFKKNNNKKNKTILIYGNNLSWFTEKEGTSNICWHQKKRMTSRKPHIYQNVHFVTKCTCAKFSKNGCNIYQKLNKRNGEWKGVVAWGGV